LAEFSTLEDAICSVSSNHAVPAKTTYLRVENSAQQAFRFSPVTFVSIKYGCVVNSIVVVDEWGIRKIQKVFTFKKS
jgi:hypothetical protein